MAQFFQNGVTSGGDAPITWDGSPTASMYIKYLQDEAEERKKQDAQLSELISSVDLSKLDPRDREYIDNEYNAIRTIGAQRPTGTKRGDVNAWRGEVNGRLSKLQNKIAETINARKGAADTFTRMKERLSFRGKDAFEKDFSNTFVDPKTGQVRVVDFNGYEIEPEKFYDWNSDVKKVYEKNAPNNTYQLDLTHRKKDGKTEKVNARVFNQKGFQSEVGELLKNAQFKDSFERQVYNVYKKQAEENKIPVQSIEEYFTQYAVNNNKPVMTERDLEIAKDYAEDGKVFYGVTEVSPNYTQVNVSNSNSSAADKVIEANANYIVTALSTLENAFRTDNTNKDQNYLNANSIITKALKDGDDGENGKIINARVVNNGLEITSQNARGLLRKRVIHRQDQDWASEIYNLFNNKQLPTKRVPAEIFNALWANRGKDPRGNSFYNNGKGAKPATTTKPNPATVRTTTKTKADPPKQQAKTVTKPEKPKEQPKKPSLTSGVRRTGDPNKGLVELMRSIEKEK